MADLRISGLASGMNIDEIVYEFNESRANATR